MDEYIDINAGTKYFRPKRVIETDLKARPERGDKFDHGGIVGELRRLKAAEIPVAAVWRENWVLHGELVSLVVAGAENSSILIGINLNKFKVALDIEVNDFS